MNQLLRVVFHFTFFALGMIAVAQAADKKGVSPDQTKWGWFSAISTQNSWSVEQGPATVAIKGNGFDASLVDPSSQERISLKGTIKKNAVEVIATRRETDDAPRKLSGSIAEVKWPGGIQRESIILHEVGKPSGLTIGITRDLSK